MALCSAVPQWIGHNGRQAITGGTVAFGEPFETDGVAVIPAASVRTHCATKSGTGSRPRGLEASLSGCRPAGAFVARNGAVHWHPALDVTRLLTTGGWLVGAVLIANRLAARPSAACANVTMGPGGWVNMKGGSMAVRPSSRLWRRQHPATRPSQRPWWARLLAAKSLQSLLSW